MSSTDETSIGRLIGRYLTDVLGLAVVGYAMAAMWEATLPAKWGAPLIALGAVLVASLRVEWGDLIVDASGDDS